MKRRFPRVSIYKLRVFSACLLSFLILTAPIAPLAGSTKGASPIKTSQDHAPQRVDQTREKLSPNPLVNSLSPVAATITATLTDDIGLGAKKNPGDTITYTATISNAGVSPADDALNVIFTDVLDSNTTLVGGSVNAQPIAKPDSYTASGNIPISLAAPGVLTNDIDPDNGTNSGLTVTEVQG